MKDEWIARIIGNEPGPNLTQITGEVTASSWAPVSDVDFREAIVTRVSFAGRTFSSFSTSASRFDNCDFSGVTFDAGMFGTSDQTTYRDCRFVSADLRSIDPGNSRFERCSFEGAKIHEWSADAAEFVGCRFAGSISDSRFSGRPWGIWDDELLRPHRTMNEFRSNDFRKSTLIACEFIFGIPIGDQHWPEGPGYVRLNRWPERVARVRRAIAELQPSLRADVEVLLAVYGREGYDDQQDLFADKYSLGMDPGAADHAWHTFVEALP